jgi:Ser/Thr protein kinase RdoA (MazF antagonist)
VEKQHLRDQLAALHAALADAESVGPEARDLLRAVMDDIQRVLELEEREREPEGLVDRLREAVEDFEESHPTLAEATGRVIDALARMGI